MNDVSVIKKLKKQQKKTISTEETRNFLIRIIIYKKAYYHISKRKKVKNKIIKQRLNSTQLYAISEI